MESIKDFLFDSSGWLIVSIVLFALEFLAPGIAFMWLGFAGVMLAGVVYFFPDISWQVQLFSFSVLGVALVFVGKKYLMEKEVISDDTTLNRRGLQYIGRVCEVVVPFKNGKGKIKVEDTLWTATGPSTLAKGKSVKIIDVDGTRFKVEVVK